MREMALRLQHLLQQDLFTRESFEDMKSILDRLEEEGLPLELVSACMLLKVDFWHKWGEYKDAYSHHDIMAQHLQGPHEYNLAEMNASLEY